MTENETWNLSERFGFDGDWINRSSHDEPLRLPIGNRRSIHEVDQATFGGGVGGTSRRLERAKEGCRQSCSRTGDDHSNDRAGTTAIIEGQHEQPQPPIPPQHDFTGRFVESEW
jgi:hypothetical protein